MRQAECLFLLARPSRTLPWNESVASSSGWDTYLVFLTLLYFLRTQPTNNQSTNHLARHQRFSQRPWPRLMNELDCLFMNLGLLLIPPTVKPSRASRDSPSYPRIFCVVGIAYGEPTGGLHFGAALFHDSCRGDKLEEIRDGACR